MNGIPCQSWMSREELLDGFSRRQFFQDQLDRDPRTGDHRFTHHEFGVRDNRFASHGRFHCPGAIPKALLMAVHSYCIGGTVKCLENMTPYFIMSNNAVN